MLDGIKWKLYLIYLCMIHKNRIDKQLKKLPLTYLFLAKIIICFHNYYVMITKQ